MAINPLIYYFIIGVSFGLLFEKIKITKKQLLLFSIIPFVMFSIFYFHIFRFNYNFLIIIIVSLFTISVLLFDKINEFKLPYFLVYLGNISYSIYLIHPFILIKTKFIKTDNIVLGILIFILNVVLILLFSSLSYTFIEKKSLQFIKNKFNI